MDYKLFFSTFLLIFLAELGDKTQLAALARTATAETAKWTVFAAAASALVISTLVAVLVGTALARYIPEHIIRLGAALLFLLFGAMLLRDALGRRAVLKTAAIPEAITASSGVIARVVLHAAAEFEKAAAADYRQLAAQADSPAQADLFSRLAADEEEHLLRLRDAWGRHGQLSFSKGGLEVHENEGLRHDVAEGTAPVLEHAIAHELATADLYTALARSTIIPGLKRVFQMLAHEEQSHAEALKGALS